MAVTPLKMWLWGIVWVIVPFLVGLAVVYPVMNKKNQEAADRFHQQLLDNKQKVDSLAVLVHDQTLYIENLRQVMDGNMPYDTNALDMTAIKHSKEEILGPSEEELQLREKYENRQE